MFSKEHLDKSLFEEIVNRNFNNYDIEKRNLNELLEEDEDEDDFEFLAIRRSTYIASVVGYVEEDTGEKVILIKQLGPEGFLATKLAPFTFFLLGGITLLIGFGIYKYYQNKFISEVVQVFNDYLNDPKVINHPDGILLVVD